MTKDEFDRTLNELLDREPFQAFVVELDDGNRVTIEDPQSVATRSGSALYAPTVEYIRFESANVKRFIDSATQKLTMQVG